MLAERALKPSPTITSAGRARSGRTDGHRSERALSTFHLPARVSELGDLQHEDALGQKDFLMELDGPVKKRLTLRLDAEQWDIVSEISKQANLTPAEVMRLSIYILKHRLPRGFTDRKGDPPEDFQNDVRRLWKEINSIGVNINQLARLAHMSGDAELVGIMLHAQEELRRLKRVVSKYVSHNGG